MQLKSQLRSLLKYFFATIIVFSGCFYQSTETFVPGDLPQTYHQAKLTNTTSSSTANSATENKIIANQWWQGFGDTQLNELLSATLDNNFSIKIFYSRLEQTEAFYRINRADQFPEFGLSSQVDRSQRDNRTFGNITSNYRVGSFTSYEADFWGRVRYQAQAAFEEAEASREDLYTALNSIAAEVIDTYFLAIEQCNQLALIDQTIQSDQKFYDLVYRRYLDGVAKPLDVYQARQVLVSRSAERPRFNLTLIKARDNLKILSGNYPISSKACEAEHSQEALPDTLPGFSTGIPADLLFQRPDVRAAFYRLRAADSRLAQAISERFPLINLGVIGGYSNSETADLFNPENQVWQLFADLTLPVIDFGKRRANVDQKDAGVKEASAQYAETALRAFKEVEDALAGERELGERVKLLEAKEQVLKDTLRLSMEQYLQGISDYLAVLLAQAQYYSARSELLLVKRERLTNHVQLARALGGGWPKDELKY